MRHPAQAGFNAADDDGDIPIGTANQIAVYRCGTVGTTACCTARCIGIKAAALFGNRIMVHHGIHIAGGNQKAQLWAAKYTDAGVVAPIRLWEHRHAIAAGLQHAADNRRAKGRVVDVRIP